MGSMMHDNRMPETAIDRYLYRKLSAICAGDEWWAGSISIMVGMVIQLLARGKMSHGEIAAYIGCPCSCVRLIASHYKKTVAHIHGEYAALADRRHSGL